MVMPVQLNSVAHAVSEPSYSSTQAPTFGTAGASPASPAPKYLLHPEDGRNGAVLLNTRVAMQRAASHSRTFASAIGGAVRRATTPIRAVFSGQDVTAQPVPEQDTGGPKAREGVDVQKEHPWGRHRRRSKEPSASDAMDAAESTVRSDGSAGEAAQDSGDSSSACSNESPEEERERLRAALAHLHRDLEHQAEQRRLIQASLASERSRCEGLARQNEELQKAAEERLLGQQRVTWAETSELSSQVDALLLVKKQLFQRIQALEAERGILLAEREETASERLCVACMDRLANTVLLRCKHLVCCENCAKRVTHCPVCRQSVRDRLTVFMV